MVERTNRENEREALYLIQWNLRNLEDICRSAGKTLDGLLQLVTRGLVRGKQYEALEKLNDELKPIADYLIHLDLSEIWEVVHADEAFSEAVQAGEDACKLGLDAVLRDSDSGECDR